MLSVRKKLNAAFDFFAQCFIATGNSDDYFPLAHLPTDILKIILAIFLHDTLYSDPKSFINLALTSKILNELATDVFFQGIRTKDILKFWSIVNEKDGYLAYEKSLSPRNTRRTFYAVDTKSIESSLIEQVNDNETDFIFKAKRSYRLYSQHAEALEEQKRCEWQSWLFISKNRSVFLEKKPAVYEVYCSKHIGENKKNVNPHQLFYVRAEYPVTRDKVGTLSLENCLPLTAQRRHDDLELDKNRDNNDQTRRDYDKRFGLVCKK